jgi:hypothetical protein
MFPISSGSISRQRVQLGRAIEEGDPKSDGSGRTIALDPSTVAALRAPCGTENRLYLRLLS